MAREEGKEWEEKIKSKENITWLINSHKIRAQVKIELWNINNTRKHNNRFAVHGT